MAKSMLAETKWPVEKQKPEPALVVKNQWSLGIRINHWAVAVCITVLIISGFYIGLPLTIAAGETWQKFFVANVRFVHLTFGLALTALLVWRAYLAFFSRSYADWKDFLSWLEPKKLYKQVKFYTLISNEAPEHEGLYGPVQAGAYCFLFFLVSAIVVTGLILYGALHPVGLAGTVYAALRPLGRCLGGLAGVRFIHHVLTWGFVVFICAHVYMAFWNDIVFKKGLISSIIIGRSFEKAGKHH